MSILDYIVSIVGEDNKDIITIINSIIIPIKLYAIFVILLSLITIGINIYILYIVTNLKK